MERKVFKEGIMKETDHGPVLLALRCKNCGQFVFPPEGEVCTNCLSTDYDTVELPQTGILRLYTVHYRPVNTPFPIPHAIGQVDLGGVISVYAPLKIEGEMKVGDEFKNGSKVEIMEDDYYTLKDGTTVYGYKFRVVE